MATTLAKQLAKLPVVDKLQRAENPIAGPWVKWPPANEIGECDAEGYGANIAYATGPAGALYSGTTFKVGEFGFACTVTLAVPHHAVERYFELWVCASTTGGGRGFRLVAEETSTDTWTLKLQQWGAGVLKGSSTIATGVPIDQGGAIGITVQKAGLITGWVRENSGLFTAVGTITDGTYTEGNCGIGVRGSNASLSNFSSGPLSLAPSELATTTAARVTSEPVDDTLYVRLRHADGSTSRWAGDSPDASGVPSGISFADAAPGGDDLASCNLARDPRKTWPDLELVDELEIYGRVEPLGRKAFMGQTAHFPSELGDDVNIGVNAVGNQVLLTEDEAWTALFVQLGFEGWNDSPLARRQMLAGLGWPQGKVPVSTQADGLVWDPPAGVALSINESTDVINASPADLPVAKVGYRGKRTGSWTNCEGPTLYAADDETVTENFEAVNLTLDEAPHVATLSKAHRYLMLRSYVTGSTSLPAGTQQAYERLARYGDHGLTLREVEGGKELPGVYGHDAIAYTLDTGAPDLNYRVAGDGSIVPNTSVVLPDLAFTTPGKPSGGIEKINAYFLNNWGVYDEKEFFWKPWDPDVLTWDVSIAGGAHWSPAGRQAFTLLNEIIVSYVDHRGIPRTAGPPGSGCDYEDASLRDPDPSNPYTRRGKKRRGLLEVGFPLAYPSIAFQVGYVYLQDHKVPQRSGTLVIRPKGAGHVPEIRHPTIGPVPPWAMRSGDYAYLNGWPDPEPFRVISRKYDGDSKTLVAQLESASMHISAIMERVGIRLTRFV